MFTGTHTTTNTYTVTQAKYIASKIKADLKRCQQIYGAPSDASIENYEEELVVLLKGKYVDSYEFGFKTGATRVVSWRYVARYGELEASNDDDPGKLYRKADISGAHFFNFLCSSNEWSKLSREEKEKVESSFRIRRSEGTEPTDGNGYWTEDKNYSAIGVSTTRKVYRSF